MKGLILALILFGFAAFVYQGLVHADREAMPEAAPAATLSRP